MGLSEKYNQFSTIDYQKETFDKIQISKYPVSRHQAIVSSAGQGNTLLDIGCNNGYLLYQFKETFTNLIGLEYSASQIERARINLEGLNFLGLVGSPEDMPQITSNSIDTIITADTIEHIPDVYAATEEMFRVLKPGGTLIINTPNIGFIKKRFLLLLGFFPSTSEPNEGIGTDPLFDGGHLHYFTYRSLKLVLERAGFVMINKTAYGKFGFIQNIYPELLSSGLQWHAKKPEDI